MKSKKHILVAPLNWGLGHATRCVPIINTLLSRDYKVTLASDGSALEPLKKEFPELPTLQLPGHNVTYARHGKDFKRKISSQISHIRRTIKAEHRVLDHYIDELKVDGIISDSRFGMYSDTIPSVLISHQLTVLSGNTTRISSYINRQYINRFTECWVPDYAHEHNLSGLLGHPNKVFLNVKYIGPLSRMQKNILPQKYEITAILSGPEPQRSLLEDILINQLKKYNGNVLIVQGILAKEEQRKQLGNIEMVNFLTTHSLEKAINESDFIISRSGYTTVMDLAAMQKKVFFIPTPGQPEQEYLAAYLKKKGIAPFAHQDDFSVKDLSKLSIYKGFTAQEDSQESGDFFGLFEGEGKLGTHSKFTLDIHLFFVRLNNMFNNRESQT